MKRKGLGVSLMGVLALAAAICASLNGCAQTRPPEIAYQPQDGLRYTNHIELDGQWGASIYTGESEQYGIGDPFVLRYNGKYYLYPSTSDPCDGIKVFQSEDLVNWTDMGYAVEPSDATAHGAYAPEVIYYNGWFYLCQSRAGQGHYIYRSESPTEGFVLVSKSELEPGDLNYGNMGLGIDGSFYVSDDGKLYLLHTSSSGLKYTLIADPENIHLQTLGPTGDLGAANLRGWIEGPGVFRRGEYSYLTYTGNYVYSRGYRIGYSYAKNLKTLSEFVQPKDNVTIMNTDSQHYGLGHGSNVTGPDLDAVYTAYHSMVDGGPGRRYNLDRYLTCGGILTANGVTHWPVLAPARPTAEAQNGEALQQTEGRYILGTAGDYFTAEFNFTPAEGQKLYFGDYEVQLSQGSITLSQKGAVIAKKEIAYPEGRLNTVRVENGDGVGYVYLNGMRLIAYEAKSAPGQIGYATAEGVEYTAFTNDVFGTSDFEALKNFPTEFPAVSYLKGENRGFSIQKAKVVSGGLRVGEKQSLVAVEENDCWAVRLEKNDWVKYGIDVPETGSYFIGARITKASAGAKIRITVGQASFTCTLPKDLSSEADTVTVSLGTLSLEAGMGAMKVEVLSGAAEFITFESRRVDAEPEKINLSHITVLRGDVAVTDKAVILTGVDDHSVALWGDAGVGDFQAEIQFTCKLDNSSNLGFMLRATNYSYSGGQPIQSWQGYFLQLGQHILSLNRYDYGDETLGAIRLDDAFAERDTHTLRITAQSNQITVVLDEVYRLTVSDSYPFLNGRLGIFATGGQISVTDFQLTVLSPNS